MAVAATNIASVLGGGGDLLFLPAMIPAVTTDIASFSGGDGNAHCSWCIVWTEAGAIEMLSLHSGWQCLDSASVWVLIIDMYLLLNSSNIWPVAGNIALDSQIIIIVAFIIIYIDITLDGSTPTTSCQQQMDWRGWQGGGRLDKDSEIKDGLVRTNKWRMVWQGQWGGGWLGKDKEVRDGSATMTRSRMVPQASLVVAASFPLRIYELMYNVMNHTHPS